MLFRSATVAVLPVPSLSTGSTIAAQVIATYALLGAVGIVAAEPPVFTARFGKQRLLASFGNPRLMAGFGSQRFEARFK